MIDHEENPNCGGCNELARRLELLEARFNLDKHPVDIEDEIHRVKISFFVKRVISQTDSPIDLDDPDLYVVGYWARQANLQRPLELNEPEILQGWDDCDEELKPDAKPKKRVRKSASS